MRKFNAKMKRKEKKRIYEPVVNNNNVYSVVLSIKLSKLEFPF